MRSPWGLGIGYSGHKHQKGEKELTIVENQGFVIGPLSVKPINPTTSLHLAFCLASLSVRKIRPVIALLHPRH